MLKQTYLELELYPNILSTAPVSTASAGTQRVKDLGLSFTRMNGKKLPWSLYFSVFPEKLVPLLHRRTQG